MATGESVDPMNRLLRTCVDPETMGMVMHRMIKDELERRSLDSRGQKDELIVRLIEDNIKSKQAVRDESEDSNGEEPPEQPVVDEPVVPIQIPQAVPGQNLEIYFTQMIGALGAIMQQNQEIQVNMQRQQLEDKKELQKQITSVKSSSDIQIHTTPDLYSSIPQFYGKRTDDAREWLENLNRVARQQNWTSETKLSTAASLLRAEALDWQDTSGYKVREWDDWTDLFLTHFYKPLTVREWTSMVEARTQQSGELLSEYVRAKLKIVNRSPVDVPLRDQLDYLISGIKHKTTAHILKLQHFTDVYELLEAVREIDEQNSCAFSSKPEPSMKQKDVGEALHIPRRLENCDKEPRAGNRFSRSDNHPDKQTVYRKGMDKRGMTCFNCDQKGHLSYECDRPRRPRGTNGNVSFSNSKINQNAQRKVNCLLRSRERTLPVVTGFLGKCQVNVLLDSGSEVSLIDKKILPENSLIRNCDDDQELSILGSTYKPLGYAIQTVRIGDIEETVPMCIAENLPYPVLLGANWRQIANVCLTVFPNSDVEIQKLSENCTRDKYLPLGSAEKKSTMGCILITRRPVGQNVNVELSLKIESVLEKVDSEVSSQDKTRLKEILTTHAAAFSNEDHVLGCCPEVEHSIFLKDDIPIKSRPYRYSWHDRDYITEVVNDWIKKGIAQESISEYCSPVVLVNQPSHTTTPRRLCIDYRRLNEKTVKVNYPMPRIEDVIEVIAMNDATYFNTMDIKTAFMTVRVRPEDRSKTAFITQDGLFEFRRMPFGLSNAPATMQSVMNRVFHNIPRTGTYIDDIGQGGDSPSDLLDVLETALERTIESGLLVNLEKCQFLQKSVKFLGQIVSRDGVIPDPDRTAAIDRYSNFETTKQVRSFVQFVSHFRKFIKNFSSIAKPLNELLKKDVPFAWTDAQEEAVKQLREKLKSAPILGHFRRDCQSSVHVDASQEGLGAVLMQKQNGRDTVIEYASRSLSDSERKLHSNALECLALHWAIAEKFRVYLYGGPQFTVFTDNWSAKYLMIQSQVNRKFARWMLDLQEFDYVIKHTAGKLNAPADSLSRLPGLVCMAVVIARDSRLKRAQMEDEFCIRNLEILGREALTSSEVKVHQEFEMIEGFLVRKSEEARDQRRCLVIPKSLQDAVLKLNHDRSGHMNHKKTFSKLKTKYWWKTMNCDTVTYVKSCHQCQVMNSRTSKPEGLLVPRNVPGVPYEVVSVDHFGPLERVDDFTHVLICIDHATRHVIAEPVTSTSSSCFIDFLRERVFSIYGIPHTIVSDQGTGFTSGETTRYLEEHGVKQEFSPPYWPRANGLVERSVATVKSILRKVSGESDWPSHVRQAAFSYNVNIHSASKYSPFYLLHGYNPNTYGELKLGVIREDLDRVNRLVVLQERRKLALKNLQSANESMKERHDKHHKSAKYKIGDSVLYCSGDRSNSLAPLFEGPYIIEECLGSSTYLILSLSDDEPEKKRKAHAHQLKIFRQRPVQTEDPEPYQDTESDEDPLPKRDENSDDARSGRAGKRISKPPAWLQDYDLE